MSLAKYDPSSYEESPELLGVVNGFSGDGAFIHMCDRGFSTMAFPPFNRDLKLGDFVLVKVRLNPDSQPNHRSKHRVQKLLKVSCPSCVKRIGENKRHVMLKVAVRPVENCPDALILHDEVIGSVIDNNQKVPVECLKNPDRLVLVTVRIIVSPKDGSSIFVVDQFVGYEDPGCDQGASSSSSLSHKGCIWDYRKSENTGRNTFFVWSKDFDRELELSPSHFENGLTDRGSWIQFDMHRQTDSNALEIQNFEFIHGFLPIRNTKDLFEVKINCEYLGRRDHNGASLFTSAVFLEIADSHRIVPDSQLMKFPLQIWLSPCINSGTWEISQENKDLFQQRPHPATDRSEKTGMIVHDDKNYYVWSAQFEEDLILHKEIVKNEPNLVGKWIRFRDVTYATGRHTRHVINGDVEFIDPVIPTRMGSNVPQVSVTCTSLENEDTGYPVFHSDEVGGVIDVYSMVDDPHNVAWPFTVWAAYQKSRELRCRWSISSVVPQDSITVKTFAPKYPNDKGNYIDRKTEKTGFIVYDDVVGNNCYVWSPDHKEDLILRRESLKNEADIIGKWIRFRDATFSYGRYVILGEVEIIPDVLPKRLNSNVPELNVSCRSLAGDDAGFPVFRTDDVGDIIDVHSVVRDPWNVNFPFNVWITNKKSGKHRCRWKISSVNTVVMTPSSSSCRLGPQTSSPFASDSRNDGRDYVDNRVEKNGLVVHEDGSDGMCYVWCIHYKTDLILRRDTVKDGPPDLLGKWVRFHDVSNSTGRNNMIFGHVEVIKDVLPTRMKFNIPEVTISCNSLVRMDSRCPVFYSDDVGDVADEMRIVQDPQRVQLPFTVWAVKTKPSDNMCRWKISSQNTPVVSPTPSSSRISPRETTSEAFARRYLDDGGKYTDDEDEDSPVSSSAIELPQPTVTSTAPVSVPPQVPDDNESEANKYDGKSHLELLSILLDSNRISDLIKNEDEDLHAAIVNSIFSSDSPPR